ncbi:hypothetical protein BJ165DRAFT_1534770 [Panaeolus papilionaceus]|nr:hypothetical protein BJ165DRAFT_1534770 [Panaeolus papilionaceus]
MASTGLFSLGNFPPNTFLVVQDEVTPTTDATINSQALGDDISEEAVPADRSDLLAVESLEVVKTSGERKKKKKRKKSEDPSSGINKKQTEDKNVETDPAIEQDTQSSPTTAPLTTPKFKAASSWGFLDSLCDIAIPDPMFYFEVMFLRIGTTLFAIPQQPLDVPGTTFFNMFRDATASISPYGITEGSHHLNPIVLHGIDIDEFRSFVKGAWRRTDTPLDAKDWRNVLSLATQWNFDALRLEAKAKVHDKIKDDPMDLIELGQRYQFRDWVIEGYVILVSPGRMFSRKVLFEKGMGDQICDIFLIKEAIRDFQIDPLSSLFSIPSSKPQCTTCRENNPCCCPRTSITVSRTNCGFSNSARLAPVRHANRKDKPEWCYCKCGNTMFVHRWRDAQSWVLVARMLVAEVLARHLPEKTID